MKEFEILCVTMGRNDFSLYKKMNIKSDVVFANQTNEYAYTEQCIEKNKLRMYSTQTKGVGVNRNIALLNATAKICLMADDDMIYRDGYENLILQEFEKHPKADVIIFNIGTTTPEYNRIPTITKKFKKLSAISRCPYGAPRIAFRLNSVRSKNIVFSTYFGGGCLYSNGEDTVWISQMMNAGLKVYVSPIFIGDVSYSNTTWNVDKDEKEQLYTRGAMYQAGNKKFKYLFALYYVFLKKHKGIGRIEVWKLICAGIQGYKKLLTYKDYLKDVEL